MPSDELAMINELLGTRDVASLSLEQQRAAFERDAGSPAAGTQVEPADADGVGCEWVIAPGAGSAASIMSLRGGGYCLGSLRSNRAFSSMVSEVTSSRVLNVGYRSAPEDRFPAALDDAVTAYSWLLETGIDPSRVAIVGNSAGGGLALALLLALRDGGVPLPACAAVVSPWTDLALTGESISTNAETEVMLDPVGIRDTAALYADAVDLTNPYVSPLYGDPAGLPPILIHVSDAEILLDDSTRFASRAEAAGGNVDLIVARGMPHVWHLLAGYLPEADLALGDLGRWVTAHVAAPD